MGSRPPSHAQFAALPVDCAHDHDRFSHQLHDALLAAPTFASPVSGGVPSPLHPSSVSPDATFGRRKSDAVAVRHEAALAVAYDTPPSHASRRRRRRSELAQLQPLGGAGGPHAKEPLGRQGVHVAPLGAAPLPAAGHPHVLQPLRRRPSATGLTALPPAHPDAFHAAARGVQHLQPLHDGGGRTLTRARTLNHEQVGRLSRNPRDLAPAAVRLQALQVMPKEVSRVVAEEHDACQGASLETRPATPTKTAARRPRPKSARGVRRTSSGPAVLNMAMYRPSTPSLLSPTRRMHAGGVNFCDQPPERRDDVVTPISVRAGSAEHRHLSQFLFSEGGDGDTDGDSIHGGRYDDDDSESEGKR